MATGARLPPRPSLTCAAPSAPLGRCGRPPVARTPLVGAHSALLPPLFPAPPAARGGVRVYGWRRRRSCPTPGAQPSGGAAAVPRQLGAVSAQRVRIQRRHREQGAGVHVNRGRCARPCVLGFLALLLLIPTPLDAVTCHLADALRHWRRNDLWQSIGVSRLASVHAVAAVQCMRMARYINSCLHTVHRLHGIWIRKIFDVKRSAISLCEPPGDTTALFHRQRSSDLLQPVVLCVLASGCPSDSDWCKFYI